MRSASSQRRSGSDVRLNPRLVHHVSRSEVDLSGSIYAVAASRRRQAARRLAGERMWIHADVFADVEQGVSIELIEQLACADVGQLDVHLLVAPALRALDAVCRPGVARVTFPFEGAPDPAAIAAQVRSSGVSPWLAIAPRTPLAVCVDAVRHVDGLLVMLLEPGSRDRASLALLEKVRQARRRLGIGVGVDGGVGEDSLNAVLAAGATYVVVGQRLLLAEQDA